MEDKGQAVRALALDGHGVVYRRKREVVDALVETLENEGFIFSREEARLIYVALQNQTFSGELSYEEMVEKLYQELKLSPRLSLDQLHQLIQGLSAEIEIDPELSHTLLELRSRGVRIGMITNSIHPAKVKEGWLKQAGVLHLFDLVLSSVEERCKKPAPELFFRFALRLNVRPEAVAFVGHDAQEIGGAKEAGLITISLACVEAPADFHIWRIGELLRLPIWPEEKGAR